MSKEEELGPLSPTVIRIREGMWSGTCEDGAILPFPAGTDLAQNFDAMVDGDDKDWVSAMLEKTNIEAFTYTYCSGEGVIIMGAVHFKLPGAETTVRYMRCEESHDSWPLASLRPIDPPYPLFGLEWLAAQPDAPVLLVGTEAATYIAPELLDDAVAISFPQVATAAEELDLHPLQGRTVIIVPDRKALRRFMAEKLRLALVKIGASSVFIANGEVEDWDSPSARWSASSMILI